MHRRWLLPLALAFLVAEGLAPMVPVTARPQQATSVVIESPHGSYGNLTWGWWKRSPDEWPYEPVVGPDAYWWAPEFTPTGWERSDAATVHWDGSWWSEGSIWYPWILEMGRYALRARNMQGFERWMWRSDPFDLPAGYEVTSARITIWSDNQTRWYINGHFLAEHGGTVQRTHDVPVGWLLPAGNLLAVHHRNNFNPAGFQYRLVVDILPAPPVLDVGLPCEGGSERTVTWSAQPGFEYQVQAARDAAFTQDVEDSGWITGGLYTFNGLGEGTWYYRIRSRDATDAGNWGEVQSATQDQSPPATTATPSGTVGDNGWWRSAVTVDLTAADAGCGLQGIQYRVDDGTWQPYAGPVAVSGEGVHVVEYFSTDVGGNAEPVQRLRVPIDTVPPATSSALSGLAGNGGWWRSAVTISLTAADATSGLGETWYQVDGSGWQAYIEPVAVAGDGMHTFGYRSADLAGNVEFTHSLSLQIDTAPPSTAATVDGVIGLNGWYTAPITVTLTAMDATSGVSATHLAGRLVTGPVVYDIDGLYSLSCYSIDVAGNREPTNTLSLGIDTARPVISLAAPLTFCPACGETAAVAYGADDATSGILSWTLDLAGMEVLIGTGPASGTVTWGGGGGGGTYPLRLGARDAAGWMARADTLVTLLVPTPSPTPVPRSTATPLPPSPPPPPAPTPTATPVPTVTPTAAPTGTPTPMPTHTLEPPPPTPVRTLRPHTPTPAPVAMAMPERKPGMVLRVAVFEDGNADARRQPVEPGLEGLAVRVEGGTWVEVFTTDAAGLVTVTLPGPGMYTFYLVGRPGAAWEATTRTALQVRIGTDGSVAVLPVGRHVGPSDHPPLPVGSAEGTAFAFGLVPRRVGLFLPLTVAGLLFIAAAAAALDQRAAAIRDLEETLGGAR